MCMPCHLRDPKTRAMMFAGNLSLVAAIPVAYFARNSAAVPHGWINGLSGLLYGLSIGANLMALRRRRRANQAEQA